MKLYSGPVSLFSRKVEIALGEKGLAYEREMVPFTQAGGYAPKHPAVLAANPKGQVPVLVDGDLTLCDSTLILEYLEDAYPTPALYPAEPKPKARCRQWELYADEVFLPPLRTLMYRTQPPGPDVARRQAQDAEAERAEAVLLGMYDTLEQALGGKDYFCDTVSVADIALFIDMLYTLRLGGPELTQHGDLAAWYARLRVRPAFAMVTAEIAEADQVLSYPVTRKVQ
jgi:glutathione S-transferase